jgi:pyruvate dehydrogenase E1 component alpha subunit
MAAPKKSVAKESGQEKAPEKANGSPPEFTKEQELTALRDMLLIRRFEEKAGQLYGMGAIGGFCHLYIGQEAVVVGMQMVLKKGDEVITGYRDHGHMLACGMDPKGVMAELTGRRGGYSKGKGGSMHMFSMEKNFFGGHGIVGAQVPLGTGLAFANRYRDNDFVSLAYFGDGAANQGQVYESFNMAELWKLPVIYVIENNRYAMGTSNRSTAWTSAPSRPQPTRRSPGAAPPRGPISWKCRPTAIAAIRCPIPPSIGLARRSKRSATTRTRSSRFATVCSPPR